MATMPETFPKVYVAMVSAGEAGGFWTWCSRKLPISNCGKETFAAKVTAAMLYPAILLVLSIGVLIVLMTFFISAISDDVRGLQVGNCRY